MPIIRPSMSIWTPARLALLGQELRVREARADHQQRVAVLHQVPARLRPEQPDRAGDERAGRRAAPPCRAAPSRRPAPSSSATSITSSAACRAPCADEHRDPLAGVEDLGRALELVRRRARSRARVADRRVDGAVRARRLLDGLLEAEVVRDDDAGDGALVERDRGSPGRRGGGSAPASSAMWTYSCGDVLEQRLQIDLLLVAAAERGARLLADDRDDRLMVELRVVEAVQEMDRARAGGRHADADLAGELRVGAGHERGHLLVAHLDELGSPSARSNAPRIALMPSPG